MTTRIQASSFLALGPRSSDGGRVVMPPSVIQPGITHPPAPTLSLSISQSVGSSFIDRVTIKRGSLLPLPLTHLPHPSSRELICARVAYAVDLWGWVGRRSEGGGGGAEGDSGICRSVTYDACRGIACVWKQSSAPTSRAPMIHDGARVRLVARLARYIMRRHYQSAFREAARFLIEHGF